jgi:hypothetical protein
VGECCSHSGFPKGARERANECSGGRGAGVVLWSRAHGGHRRPRGGRRWHAATTRRRASARDRTGRRAREGGEACGVGCWSRPGRGEARARARARGELGRFGQWAESEAAAR